jgi:plastocyanin
MTTRIALVTLLLALVVPSAVAQADNPRLAAVVGTNEAFVISLRDGGGNAVTTLEPGTYDVSVSDRSEMHNFHLRGPGVDQSTPVGEKQDVTWPVTIGTGRYTFMCDSHSSQMRGYFLAGAITPLAFSGSVGPKRTISLKPKTALPGPAVITVNDRSKTDNFHLSGPGLNKKTGVKTRGKVTWTVTLQPGIYRYKSDKTKKLRGSFTVNFPA